MMAALAAGRVAWNRAGLTGRKALLQNFHRKMHQTFDPHTQQRPKPPFHLHLNHPNGCQLALFRPAIRYQSTASVADTLIAEPGPPLPLENVLSAEDLVQAAQEPSFAELGLNCSTPVGLIQNVLEVLHVNVGLPWWGAIITGTVAARILIFPLIVKGQREAAKLNNHMPQINELTARLNEAKQSRNKFEFAQAYSKLTKYQKLHDVNPLRGFIVPLVQMPIFLSFFLALRKMAELPVHSLETGGLWWFSDLTAPDPYYILPLMVTATMWAVVELGAESGVSNPNLQMAKVILRVMPLIVLPITISFPTAIFIYWLTSNLFSLGQVTLLRIPSVRTYLRIEELKHQPNPVSKAPKESFVSSLKTGWKNIKTGSRMHEREQYLKEQMNQAAKGPLRGTFRHNPLAQYPPPPPPSPPPKKRPWEDTLG